ncbi:MAG: hypothetical protein VX906_00815, partial [Candidatus Thermoplasmatota archaeon]|nr:hypothetical protein [Candidatus Thermoplasmatota archaeon]
NQTTCNREPTAPIWRDSAPADCTLSVDLSILSDDLEVWSILIQNGGFDVINQSGYGSDFRGSEPLTLAFEGNPGSCTSTLELVDAAGNRQRLQITTQLDAPEATTGEQLKTPGSFHNIVALVIIVIFLFTVQITVKGRKSGDNNSWDSVWNNSEKDLSSDLSRAEFTLEDDKVVTNVESTPSNTE